MKIRIILITLLVLSACSISALTPYDLQDEIDNACNGCTVTIPAGIYEIGTVTIDKPITITGAGHGHFMYSPTLDNSAWEYYISTGYTSGTVLRGSIQVVNGGRLYLSNLSMIGYANQTDSIAIDYGNGTNQFPEGAIESVSIGNYDIGIRLRKAYYISIDDVHMAGVGVGLQITNSNVITVTGFNIAPCATGIENYGSGNVFLGGSVQSCANGVVLGGFAGVLGGYYFENLSGAALNVIGRGNTILANYYTDGELLISGHNNEFFTSETVEPVQVSGDYNRIDLSAFGSCTDTGFKNVCSRLYP